MHACLRPPANLLALPPAPPSVQACAVGTLWVLRVDSAPDSEACCSIPAMAAPRAALLLVQGDTPMYVSSYLSQVEGLRPDITVSLPLCSS
jgi:hypothetical protein